MTMPFSIEQFCSVFRTYNLAVQPIQILAYILGATAVWLVIKRTNGSDRIVSAVLAFFWLWTGGVYHLGRSDGLQRLAERLLAVGGPTVRRLLVSRPNIVFYLSF